MKWLVQIVAIGGAGAAGALLRFFVTSACYRLFGSGFPVGTFLVNITGSLFLGWFLTYAGQAMPGSETTRLAIATGFVGAYTTFSTLMFDSHALLSNGAAGRAMVNLLGSFVVGLAAVRAGVWLAQR